MQLLEGMSFQLYTNIPKSQLFWWQEIMQW